MSSTYHSTTTDPGLNHTLDTDLLSPFNQHTYTSNSASPSYHPTPDESISEYSNYQPSDLSEVDDEFFGIDFNRTNSDLIDPINTSNIDHTLPALLSAAREQHLSNLTGSTYPLSPKLTSIPNTPSPRSEAHGVGTRVTISQHELATGLHNSRFQPFIPHTPVHPASVQLTPDHSGSSRTSIEEGIAPEVMADKQWSRRLPNVRENILGQHKGSTQPQNFTSEQASASAPLRGDDGSWQNDQATGQAGLDPQQRGALSHVEVPSLKQQEEQRRIENKNTEVLEWCSQASGSNDGDNSDPSYFASFNSETWQESSRRRSLNDDNGVAPVDDAQSIHENQFQDGQLYYHPKNGVLTDEDIRLMTQPRHWSDAPMLPTITMTNFQPETANDAMRRWNENADALSLNSRTATWGTRRRSETNLADMEGVTSGSFLSKLSISKPKDREGNRPRGNSLLDQGLHGLANIVRNRSDSKLKRNRNSQDLTADTTPGKPRHNSQDTLAPPYASHHHRKSVPNMNSAFAAMTGPLAAVGTTHARSGSITAATSSPRSPTATNKNLGFTRNIMQRARSSSQQEKSAQQPGLMQLWKSQGGPPVANLASPPLDAEVKLAVTHEEVDQEDNDEDEDDDADESDVKLESGEQTEPIVADYEGFKEHVRRLNPDIDPRYRWLVSRIARQQEIRYKNLLELRVKHSQAIASRDCGSGRHCVALGGSATLLDAHGKPRDAEPNSASLQIVTDFSDHDSNPGEGALSEETFPLGVPMPPTRNLPAEFECQLCFKAKKFQKPSDWTKHVHEDVQPFTCTYEKCKEPKSFKRKADWVRHENERHRRLERWTCNVEECRHECFRKDNFLQHLVREHKLPEPKQKTKAAIKKAQFTEPVWIKLQQCHHETTNKPQDEPCKFCGKSFNTWKKLTVHLAKHMEYISLPVLNLVKIRDVDANTIISPVDHILTPVTPMDRQKMESLSPFPMGSVSPHMSGGAPYTTSLEQTSFYATIGTSAPFVGMQAPVHQNVTYDQNTMFHNPYIHQMDQPHAFSSLHSGPNNLDKFQRPAQEFGTASANYPHPRVDQPRGFNAMNSGFPHGMQGPNYIGQQPGAYPVQHGYVSDAPPSSGYQAPSMLGMSDPSFGFDHLAVDNQTYHQQQPVPMTRGPGSSSSYGHSPQTNVQQYFGHHQ